MDKGKSLIELEKSDRRRLLYAPVLDLHYVSTKKGNGNSTMERFYDRKKAEDYYHEQEEKDSSKWWWNKEN